MINRIFLLSERAPAEEPEENIYYVTVADLLTQGSLLDNAYLSVANTPLPSLGLALKIRGALPDAAIRSVAAFCFLPSYLRIDDQPVILLTGGSPELLEHASSSLKAYLDLQGLRGCRIHHLHLPELPGHVPRQSAPDSGLLFQSPSVLADHYTALLAGNRSYGNDIFFYSSSLETLETAVQALRQVENKFGQDFPAQMALVRENQQLEKELKALDRKQASTAMELNHHRQYLEVLRSNHATKELQDYYTREYEILPLWFKRVGHLVKVLTGKRTFRSLFRDDKKKG
jgi:hypothetical protein